MANWVAVHGNAIVQDSPISCNIVYSSVGAVVTPNQPTPYNATFNCSLPSCPNGSITPTNVQIQANSIKYTNIVGVVISCGDALVDNVNAPAFGPLMAVAPGGTLGTVGHGWNLQVTLNFTAAASSIDITSLGLYFT